MIDEKDFKYCKLNEASKGIFPTYFLLDLNLSEEQKTNLKNLISFLDDVQKKHTPPPPKVCPECGQSTPITYADTWWFGDHVLISQQIDALKQLLEPHRWLGDHT
jgi:hypothetical protein